MDKKNKIIKFEQAKKKKNPRHGFSLYQEGSIFYDADKNDLALKKFLEAEQEGYESAEMFCNLAWLYLNKEDWQKVEYYAQKALKCDDMYGRCYALLGDIYSNHQTPEDAEKALSCYQKAIDYDYCNDYIYLNMTKIYYTYQNNYLKALDTINKAIELEPKKGNYYAFKAEIYVENMDLKLAIKYYLKALELGYGVNDIGIYSILSSLYCEEGDFEKALEYANKVIFIDKSNGEGYYKKGLAYFGTEDVKHAEGPLLIAEEKGVDNTVLYSTLSFIYCEKKDIQKAFYYADKAIKLNKKDSYGYLAMSQVFDTKREYKQALLCIKKAYKLSSFMEFSDTAYAKYAAYLCTFHRYKSALKIIDEGLKFYPNSIGLLSQKLALLNKKKIDEAQILLNKIIELDSTAIITQQLQVFMYIELKQYDKALNTLATIDTAKDIPDIDMLAQLFLYLKSYFKIKNYEKCLEYFYKYTKLTNFLDYAIIIDVKAIQPIFEKLQCKFPNDERINFISSKMLELRDLLNELGLSKYYFKQKRR